MKLAKSVKSVKSLKSPTLTQKTFFAILCHFKRSGIPNFFCFDIVTFRGVFEEKMMKIEDDVFWEKQWNVTWCQYLHHDFHPFIVPFCVHERSKHFVPDFSIFSNMIFNQNNQGPRVFGKKKMKMNRLLSQHHLLHKPA